MQLADINTNDRYKVEGYGGVAFYYAGQQTEHKEIIEYYEDDGESSGWCVDTEEVATGMVFMVMVGDDHKHVIDPADITKIEDDEYCHECGQIGCTADGR